MQLEYGKSTLDTEENPVKGKAKRIKSKDKKPRKKIKKRWFVLGAVVIVIAVVFVMCQSAVKRAAGSLLAFDETSVIESMELTYSISATGTVVSADTKNIYSTQSYTIEEVFVKVGDTVNEGDPLCKLDSKTLEDQIEKKEISVGISAQAAAQQVKTARDAYNATKSAADQGLNSSLISAQSQVTTAYNNWEKAQKTYDEYRTSLNLGENSQILSLENQLNSARTNMDNARDAMKQAESDLKAAEGKSYDDTATLETAVATAKAEYEAAKIDYDIALNAYNADQTDENKSILVEKSEALSTKETAYNAAQQLLLAASSQTGTITALRTTYNAKSDAYYAACDSYDSLKKQLDAAYRTSNSTLEDYAKNVDIAYESYQTALSSLAAAEKSVDTQIQSSKNSLASSEISSNNDLAVLELAQMQEELEKTTVTATKTGTVTAVFAKVGNSGSGLLFVIEDTENLKVETTVKEYDMGTVKVGQAVTIKSDATGDEIIDGVIENISPASRKTASGAIDTAGDIVFPADVSVISKDTGLRIGMSVRLNYIIDQKQDVLAVPYEAIYVNDAGQDCILTVTDQGDGTHLIGELPVEVGMETDLYMEVSGAGVNSGIRVINTAENCRYLIGMKIPVADQRASSGQSGPFMMAGRVGG